METILQHFGYYEDLPDLVFKLSLAVFLSGAVGLERQRKGLPAGLRTHILVCLGSTMVMIIGEFLAREANSQPGEHWLDPGRLAAGIITGVGFLGAGTIVNVGKEQHGLTTAAMIWFVAAIGIAIGANYYLMACVGTAVALVTVVGFDKLETWIPSRGYYDLRLIVNHHAAHTEAIQQTLKEWSDFRVTLWRMEANPMQDRMEIIYRIETRALGNIESLMERLQERHPEIREVCLQR